MSNQNLEELRSRVDRLNIQILDLINERTSVIHEISKVKDKQGVKRYDPIREREMLNFLKEYNEGPLPNGVLEEIFKGIFMSALEIQEDEQRNALLVSRKKKAEDTVIDINGTKVGNGEPSFIFGPCAVESYEQVTAVAKSIKEKGLTFLRGGAYKPRTSPYDFQGLGLEGLKILKRVADEQQLSVVTEIITPAHVEEALDYLDVIQIGARNMQNFELLKEAGRTDKPVLLKRGMSATLDEFMKAAEYIISQGNENIILCERGIRTYERATRNTLDISAVPILKQETHLPVVVDVTHSTGRRDILLPAAKAALAVGADGVMAEVHPDPAVALSDAAQQMDLDQFDEFYAELQRFMNSHQM